MWQQVWPEEQNPDHRLRHGSLLRAGADTKETQTYKNTAGAKTKETQTDKNTAGANTKETQTDKNI